MVEPGGRTRPLRCFSIRVLSSASWSLSDVDCIAAGIGRVENLVRKSATFYTKFIKLNKRGKKRPKFTPFVCLRYRGAKSWGARCRSKGMAVRGLVSGILRLLQVFSRLFYISPSNNRYQSRYMLRSKGRSAPSRAAYP